MSAKHKLIPLYQAFRTRRAKYRLPLSQDSPNAIFLLAPDHGNIGDLAILEAQQSFITSVAPAVKQHTVLLSDTYDYLYHLRRDMGERDVAFIQGGGYLGGNLYPRGDYGSEWIVKYLSKQNLMSFPQSLVVSKDQAGHARKLKSARTFSRHESLTLCARETVSLHQMREIYSNEILFAPDIVLSTIDSVRRLPDSRRHFATVALRNDAERALSSSSRDKIVAALQIEGAEIVEHDNVVDSSVVYTRGAGALVSSTLDLYRKSRLVVTDRLHGMIFATITGTPCIVLPNNNHKVEATYRDWIEPKARYVRLLSESEIDRFPEVMGDLLSLGPEYNYDQVSFDFSELSDALLRNWQ